MKRDKKKKRDRASETWGRHSRRLETLKVKRGGMEMETKLKKKAENLPNRAQVTNLHMKTAGTFQTG